MWWFHNCGEKRPEAALRDPSAMRAHILELHRDDPAWIRDLIAATPAVVGPFALNDILSMPRWHADRVCLIGDAAHATTPSAGQGASLALEDAMVLAQCLRDIDDPSAPSRPSSGRGARASRAIVRRFAPERQRQGGVRSGRRVVSRPSAADLPAAWHQGPGAAVRLSHQLGTADKSRDCSAKVSNSKLQIPRHSQCPDSNWQCSFGTWVWGVRWSLERNVTLQELRSRRSPAGRADGWSCAPRLRVARTCYDHIAGTLGVALHDRFVALRWLSQRAAGDVTYDLTPAGTAGFAALGVDVEAARALRRRLAFACLDWSERTPHLGGALGAALLHLALERAWVSRNLDSRTLTLTSRGRRDLRVRGGPGFFSVVGASFLRKNRHDRAQIGMSGSVSVLGSTARVSNGRV